MIKTNERGITLTTLIIAIILLIIITGTLAINTYNSTELSSLTMLEEDIKKLESRVASYYVEHDELPIYDYSYTKTELQDTIDDLSYNDGIKYYAIDLTKLDNITLNYGTSMDTYIINEVSHNVYHLNGISYNGTIYHTARKNDNLITIQYQNNKRLPKEYKEIEYIESTGTQYIDLNLYGTNNHGIEIEYAYTSTLSTDSARLFGTRNDSEGTGAFAFISSFDGNLNSELYIASNESSNHQQSIDILWHKIDINKLNDKKVYYDDNLLFTGSDISYTANAKASLFRTYNISSYGEPTKAKVKLLKIYENATLIGEFIPCYRISDNKPGLYDIVNNIFYTNSGEGEFVIGPSVTENGVIDEQTGIPPLTLENCIDNKLIDYKIYGKVTRSGTPAIDNPATIYQVGDLVTDTSDENYGKYKIPVVATVGSKTIITNIYLNEPLRGINTYLDYIDFKNQKVYRIFTEKIFTGTETWSKVTGSSSYPNYFRYKAESSNIVGTTSSTYQLCNYFTYGAPVSSNSTYGMNIYNYSSTVAYVRIRSTELTTAAEVKAFMKEKYDAGNPVRLIYLRKAYIEEEVTLPEILTLNGTNIISVGTTLQPSSMSVTYQRDE